MLVFSGIFPGRVKFSQSTSASGFLTLPQIPKGFRRPLSLLESVKTLRRHIWLEETGFLRFSHVNSNIIIHDRELATVPFVEQCQGSSKQSLRLSSSALIMDVGKSQPGTGNAQTGSEISMESASKVTVDKDMSAQADMPSTK
jgi:hypothetical protein